MFKFQLLFKSANVVLIFNLFTIIIVLLLSGSARADVSNRSLFQNQLADSVIIIKDNSRITSIQQMLKPFEGKPVFVFLWINKCNPCLTEFSFKNSLKKYLDANNIEMLYVAFATESESLWQKQVQKRKLKGHHIRANSLLWDEIQALAWGRDISFIPAFLLFDKDGNIASKELPPPSTGWRLHKEIDAALID